MQCHDIDRRDRRGTYCGPPLGRAKPISRSLAKRHWLGQCWQSLVILVWAISVRNNLSLVEPVVNKGYINTMHQVKSTGVENSG